MHEYFTIGGGWYLYNVFSAVAAITKSTEFKFAITGAMLVSSAWLLMMIAFGQKWNIATNWLATSVVIISALSAPIATVKVTDKIDTVDSSGYIIEDVPYGLAVFSSLTSQVGNRMTRLFEDNFKDVDSPDIEKHGFLFGSRLMAEATRIEIANEHFAQSLSSFIRSCLFYDILQGRKSFEQLKVAADPWQYMTNDPANARMFELSTAQADGTWTKEIKICAAGVRDLNNRWTAEIANANRRLFRTMKANRGNKPDAAVQAIIQTELGSFHNYLIGSSRTASQLLQRQMVINAIMNEPAGWLAETGNEAGLKNYIDARLQLQTRQSYQSVGRQAERWVANLKSVFQVMYIGIFPIALMLMLSPFGATIFKNYIFGLVWVESWGALYALLNYIMNSQAREQMRAVVNAASNGSTDITLFAQAGIQRVEEDIAIMAGYLSMSIPFVSLAMVAGVSRFAYLASATLAPTQEAVASTTQETTTGNFSIGNTQYDTQTYNNTSGNQHSTSPFVDDSRSSTYAADGSHQIMTADGSNVINAGGTSESQLPIDLNTGSAHSSNLRNAESNVRSAGFGFDTQINNAISAGVNDAKTFVDQGNASAILSDSYDKGQIFSDSTSINEARSVLNELAKNNNVTDREALSAVITASTGMQIAGNGVKAEAAYNASTDSTISFQDALKVSQNESVAEAINKVTNYGHNERADWQTSRGTSLSDTISAHRSEVDTLTDTQNAYYRSADELSKAADRAESYSSSINSRWNQPFVDYYEEMYGKGALSDLTSSDLATRDLVAERAAQFMAPISEQYVEDTLAEFNINPEVAYPHRAGVIRDEGTGAIAGADSANRQVVVESGEQTQIQLDAHDTKYWGTVGKATTGQDNLDSQLNSGEKNTNVVYEASLPKIRGELNKTVSERAVENTIDHLTQNSTEDRVKPLKQQIPQGGTPTNNSTDVSPDRNLTRSSATVSPHAWRKDDE